MKQTLSASQSSINYEYNKYISLFILVRVAVISVKGQDKTFKSKENINSLSKYI